MLLAVFVTGPAWSGETTYRGHGLVKHADATAGTVTIDHEKIPGLMMGMTMEFRVSDPEMLEGIAPGQAVDFRLRDEDGRFS